MRAKNVFCGSQEGDQRPLWRSRSSAPGYTGSKISTTPINTRTKTMNRKAAACNQMKNTQQRSNKGNVLYLQHLECPKK